MKQDPAVKPPRITDLAVEVREAPAQLSEAEQERWAESYLAFILQQDGLPSLEDETEAA